MRVLRAEDAPVTPWKNGGGTTAEIAAEPHGAGLDAFRWRVSVARVEADGPFSLFPGIDRTLCVIEGEGIELTVGDGAPVRLTATDAPFSFPADVPTSARLLAGPIRDLNVMSRRGARHAVEIMAFGEKREVRAGPGAALLVVLDGAARVTEDATGAVLERLDAARLGPGEVLGLTPERGAVRAALVRFAPA